jgi:hypothetical protein
LIGLPEPGKKKRYLFPGRVIHLENALSDSESEPFYQSRNRPNLFFYKELRSLTGPYTILLWIKPGSWAAIDHRRYAI